MKLNCTIEIINRNVSDKNKTKKTKSVLAISKYPNTDVLCLYLFNPMNKHGKKYDIRQNITQIFTKFVNEGKSTIRFIKPPDDILIQAEPLELKHFLSTIKLSLTNGTAPIKEIVSNMGVTVKKKEIAPTTKLVITKRSDYPIHGFPRTVTCLRINDLKRMSFDKGILNLQRLHTLDLSNNLISTLPEAFNQLPNLTVLNLSNNQFGSCRDWRWIGKKVGKTLMELDLSSNHLRFCPININFFEKLVNLNISSNKISVLPNSICSMRSLRILNLSHNLLKYLPIGLYFIYFDSLDVSDNCYVQNEELSPDSQTLTLLDLSASCVLYNRLKYPEEMIPYTLQQYLLKAMYCYCGKVVFSKRYRRIISFYKRYIRAKSIVNDSRLPTIEGVFCSQKCYLTQ
ncbi:leucine-rich repeat protein 1 [Chrysoperla carnea]|uniref:leucine-rich repeat protein 1 n=1 Tax=Chrysoperla carnea TaxID=189513 RepID=UPI001D091E39|nr:leucine-rich repeat protein 1 [Chrysoperla carnea]